MLDEEKLCDIENAILRSGLSVEEIAIAFRVTVFTVKRIMKDLLSVV